MDESSMDWDIEEYSSEADSSKVSWLWNKGVAIGRKVLVTGMVISSAPFVLPPLVVVSALGVAVSVPYGLFFASYACSEKLMSSLLTNPYEEGIWEEKEGVGFGGNIDTEKEDIEQTEDMKEQLNMRFELVDGNEEEKTMVVDSYDNRRMVEDFSWEVRNIIEKDDDIIEGSLSKQPRDEMRGVLLTLEVDENDGSKFNQIGAPLEVTNVVLLESGGVHNIGEDELVRETRDLIEKFSDEGKPHNPVEEEKMRPKGMHGAADEIDMLEAKNYGKKGKRKGRKKEKAEEKRIENLPRERDVHKLKHSGNTHTDRDKRVAGLVVEEKKPIREESEKMIAHYRKEKTSTKVDAGSFKQGTSKGNVQENSLGNGDVEIPISLASSGLKDGRGPQILAGRGISPSFIEDQEIDGEEKIWQQIKAMRKIVGYKAKLQASCIEELKSLYLFTGVEPPTSFKDTSDLGEVNNKLRFLMSVVGVK